MPPLSRANSTNALAPVVYISYDGMAEPLGRSQVLGYLERLTDAFDVVLVSFEKPADNLDSLRGELAGAGLRWFPLRYHRRPAVLSTVIDVFAGVRALRAVQREREPAIIHVRSYVPALIAFLNRRGGTPPILFDIRGFWADERVEGGLWKPGGLLYRVAKRCERRFFSEADAVVTLTQASIPQIREWLGTRQVPVVVIPTCVDLDRFADRPQRTGGPNAVWSGSLGTWYRFDLVPPLVRAMGVPLTVVTRQRQEALDLLGDLTATIVSRPPDQVPGELYAGDIGLCLIKSSFSKIASAPTRLAEYLAAGMPVVVNSGAGDMQALVEDNRVGVVLHSECPSDITSAAAAALEMANDPLVPQRCREVAREHFDVDIGAQHYAALYREMLSASPAVSPPSAARPG